MVDSSVGGKTGVDHSSGKNRIGAFHQPRMVWINTGFLDTLPQREFLAGYGEVFKYAFIGGREMFSFIRQNSERIIRREPGPLLKSIEMSVRIKTAIVSDDEHEISGRRALLNFGHTFAHALEACLNYEDVLHGEAVLWGIACAIDLGKRTGTIPESCSSDYDSLLQLLPRIKLPSLPSATRLCEFMLFDKKVSAGRIRFVLPSTPGESVMRDDIGEGDLLASIGKALSSSAQV
jgi:3-dehydroquinate synthase